jgi:hypothetical protein
MEPICELDRNLRFPSPIIRRWLEYIRKREEILPNATYASERNTTSYMKAFFNLTEYIFAANKLAVADKGDHKDRIS